MATERDRPNVVPIIMVALGIGAIVISLVLIITYFTTKRRKKTVIISSDHENQ